MTAVFSAPHAALLETPLSLVGVCCRLLTNSAPLAARLTAPEGPSTEQPRWQMTIHVDADDRSPLGEPHFRGMHHLATASFGARNRFVFDLRRREVAGIVSAAVAESGEFWHRTLLPIAAGLMGAAIGVLPVHGACLARGTDGMLVAGISGTGKSTLALALAFAGLDYISDDWSYCSLHDGELRTHATAARLKLLPDAVRHFPALSRYTTGISMNGEEAYEIDPDREFDLRRARACRPGLFVFYRRTQDGPTGFAPLTQREARSYLEDNVERLPEQLVEAHATRSRLMDTVAALPCWQFTSAAPPATAAAELVEFFDSHRSSHRSTTLS